MQTVADMSFEPGKLGSNGILQESQESQSETKRIEVSILTPH